MAIEGNNPLGHGGGKQRKKKKPTTQKNPQEGVVGAREKRRRRWRGRMPGRRRGRAGCSGCRGAGRLRRGRAGQVPRPARAPAPGTGRFPGVLRPFLEWVEARVRLCEWGEDVASGSRPASSQGWLRVGVNRQCDAVKKKGRSNLILGEGCLFVYLLLGPCLIFCFFK